MAAPREPGSGTLPVTPAGPDQIELARITSAAKAGLFGGRAQPIEIGRFTVLRTLGAGGMGRVYLAYDPQLDRRVALKLVSPTVGDARKRLLREAKALARVTHPNIVHVYEVGTHKEEVYLAMEYVRGKTLTPWRRERERSVSEIVSVFAACARGLEAAHAARLVHRDVKPSNIIVGDEGRVRVVDFGLARRRGASSVSKSAQSFEPSSSGFNLTRTGQVTGTPAYMSPEQFTGENVGPTSDQFSLCAALYEAIFDERPFQSSEGPRLAAAVIAGKRDPVPNTPCPRRLRALLERGLSLDPNDRFESMTALLKELEPPQRRRAFAIVGTALVAASATWAVVRSPESAVKPCNTESSEQLWNEDTRAKVRAAQADPDRPATWDAQEAYLASYSLQLVALHQAACDAHAEAKVDDRVQTWQRLSCYETKAIEFRSVLESLSDPRVGRIEKAYEMTAELERCSDVALLRELAARGGTPQGGTETPDLLAQEVRVRALHLAGRHDAAVEAAAALSEEARQRGVPSVEGEGLLLQAQSEQRRGFSDKARDLYHRVADLAAESGDDRMLARVWLRLLRFYGMDLGRPQEAEVLVPVARAAVARAGGGADLEGAFARRVADLAYRRGDAKEAIDWYEKAIEIANSRPIVSATDILGLRSNIAGVYSDLGSYERAIAAGEEVLDTALELGIDDPEIEALTHFKMHTAFSRLRRYDEAQYALDAAYQAYEGFFGPGHPMEATVIDARAQLEIERGEFVAAWDFANEAVKTRTTLLEPDHPDIATSWNTLGLVYQRSGDEVAATDAYHRAYKIWHRRLGAKHPSTLVALSNWGGALLAADRTPEAQEVYELALKLAVEVGGASGLRVAYALVGLADIDLRQGRSGAAIERLERALTIAKAAGGSERLVANVQRGLATALLKAGKSRTRARELARSSERFYSAHAISYPTMLEAVRGLIAEHGL